MKKSIGLKLLAVCMVVFTLAFKSEDTVKKENLSCALVFWTRNCNYSSIEIYVDNRYYGDITECYDGPPECAAEGCVTVTISGPNNFFRAQTKDGKVKWVSKKAKFNSNTCNSEELL